MESLEDMSFANKAQELNAHIEQGEAFGDKARIEAALQVRSAIHKAGRSESSVGHISKTESNRGNGKQAVASYNPSSGETKLGDLDTLIQISQRVGQSVRKTTEQALLHEKRHELADKVEGAKETDAVISFLLGEEAALDVEETNASLGTTETWDAYADKRKRAQGYAQELRISFGQLIAFKKEGDFEGLLEAAANSGNYDEKLSQAA